jgi:hypothetical protein
MASKRRESTKTLFTCFFAVTYLLPAPALPVACLPLFVRLELFEVGSPLVHLREERARGPKLLLRYQKEKKGSYSERIEL